ncbi:DnaJ subfamily C member 8 [Amphibalanus amphitrite]|uniref:DnaJ subfamily C member 8 n=1 Tax=Amphibalanus amphitrite TaxID=1232801 RepID=A0A6A4WKD6_AMPAM|nr:DnaJ subfamily C member 8 [Amphibalanus amphitrite]
MSNLKVKQIEKQDAVLTSAQQIERLLRPGATYRNLNPFEVLQIDPDLPVQDLKKKYKRMSILVHPDKNPDDRERAQTAFDIPTIVAALVLSRVRYCLPVYGNGSRKNLDKIQKQRHTAVTESPPAGLHTDGRKGKRVRSPGVMIMPLVGSLSEGLKKKVRMT